VETQTAPWIGLVSRNAYIHCVMYSVCNTLVALSCFLNNRLLTNTTQDIL